MHKSLIFLILLSCNSGNTLVVPPDAEPPMASFGEGCDSDDTCETGLCVDSSIVDIPDGLCTRDCVWGSGCEEGYCVFYDDNVGHCWPSCEIGDSPCREGWECVFIVGVRLCAPEELAP